MVFAHKFIKDIGILFTTNVNILQSPDVYLLGTVMLVFGMGLYELFISNLNVAAQADQPTNDNSHRSNLFGLFKLLVRTIKTFIS